ncbi:MAG: fructose-bisphosphate aldolase [Candidatus Korarchaeota archaeon NZ13-K]|nr:MAG: fructose-bisphosphate aldolase [Candidatus Korarchaeota archaeon NZ13-K]
MMWGKEVRLSRIMRDGKILCIPMDHGVTDGPIRGLTDINWIVGEVSRGGATCVVLHKGMIKSLREPKVPVIMHMSASTSLGPEPNRKVRVADVIEAVRLGADAVSVHVNVGGERSEPEMLEKLGLVAAEADELGMPLLAMMYARGPNVKDRFDPSVVAMVARIGAELGADVVKVPYTGDPDSFKQVTRSVSIPVVIAGGPKMENEMQVLEMVAGAIEGGAAGVSIGRNVFQHEKPAAMVRAIAAILFERMSPEEAAVYLR